MGYDLGLNMCVEKATLSGENQWFIPIYYGCRISCKKCSQPVVSIAVAWSTCIGTHDNNCFILLHRKHLEGKEPVLCVIIKNLNQKMDTMGHNQKSKPKCPQHSTTTNNQQHKWNGIYCFFISSLPSLSIYHFFQTPQPELAALPLSITSTSLCSLF